MKNIQLVFLQLAPTQFSVRRLLLSRLNSHKNGLISGGLHLKKLNNTSGNHSLKRKMSESRTEIKNRSRCGDYSSQSRDKKRDSCVDCRLCPFFIWNWCDYGCSSAR